MMMAEKIRNVLLKIIGFVTGTIVTIIAVYLFGTTALLLVTFLFIAYIIKGYNKNRDKLKKLEKQMETLKNEIEKIKDKQ